MSDNVNMNVVVSFPGLEKKSAPVRSLVNFMMENSSLYFVKNIESDNNHVFTVTSYNDESYEAYAHLYLSGNWYEMTKDLVVYGSLKRSDEQQAIKFCYPVNECTGEADVLNPDGGDGNPSNWAGWDNLIASEAIPHAVNYSEQDSTVTVTLIDDSQEPATVKDFSGTLHVFCCDVVSQTSQSPAIDGDYQFEHGACTIEVGSNYSNGLDMFVFSADVKTRVIGNIMNRYLATPYSYSFGEQQKMYNLYIRYDDKDNAKFEPIQKPAKAHAESRDIGEFIVRAKTPGEDGNKYRLVVDSVDDDGYKEIELSLYYDDELIGTGIPNQHNYNGDHEVQLANCVLSSQGKEDVLISDILEFDHFNGSTYTYYIFDVDADVYPIELQFSGGSEDGGEYDYLLDRFIIPFADCNTVLCKANTSVTAGEISTGGYSIHNADYRATEDSLDCAIGDVKAVITPMIDGKENTNENVVPDNFNEYGLASVPLAHGKDLNYDVQLRTTSFTVAAWHIDENTGDIDEDDIALTDVFYKVGVCPLDGTEKTRDDLIELIKHSVFTVCVGDYDYSADVYFASSSPHSPQIDSSYNNNIGSYSTTRVVDIDKIFNGTDNFNSYEAVPKSIIFPIIKIDGTYHGGGKIDPYFVGEREVIGFAYFKLCNTNGTPYTVEADSEVVYDEHPDLSDQENAPSPTGQLNLAFKDRMLDSGYSRFPKIERHMSGEILPYYPIDDPNTH